MLLELVAGFSELLLAGGSELLLAGGSELLELPGVELPASAPERLALKLWLRLAAGSIVLAELELTLELMLELAVVLAGGGVLPLLHAVRTTEANMQTKSNMVMILLVCFISLLLLLLVAYISRHLYYK